MNGGMERDIPVTLIYPPSMVLATSVKRNMCQRKGRKILFFGRIVAVADVYDALSSPRCYKEVWEEEQILEEIQKSNGTHSIQRSQVHFFPV